MQGDDSTHRTHELRMPERWWSCVHLRKSPGCQWGTNGANGRNRDVKEEGGEDGEDREDGHRCLPWGLNRRECASGLVFFTQAGTRG